MSSRCGPCLKGQRINIPRGYQDPEWPGFVAKDTPYDCAQCIRYWAAEKGFAQLEAPDVQAWNLWWLLQNQQRIGMDVIGLDYAVLPAVFDLEGIVEEDRRALFHKLVALDHTFTQHRRDEQQKQAESASFKHGGGRR